MTPSACRAPRKSRQFRNDHLRDGNLARDRDRMQRPGAAERDHRGVARIEPLLTETARTASDMARPRCVAMPSAAVTRIKPERFAELRLDRRFGGGAVERHVAAQKALRH